MSNIVPLPRGRDPSAYRPQPGRDGPDFWPTVDPGLQHMAVYRVLQEVSLEIPIWEFAAGEGHLVDPIRRRGRLVIATDLFPGRPDIGCHDFLHGEPPPETCGAVAMTNPPNSQLTEFIVRGLALMDTGWLAGMALLTRLGADTTKGRGASFNRAAYVWKSCWRPYWKPRRKGDQQPRWTAQWTLWLADHSGPPATLCLTHEEIVAPRLF
ncbi:MAG: hypothetical protein J2P48_01220 [Alphaproteobacteria bacterium]|nr:hypothetical protein [Alphaproteobacteria bacterium]